MQHTTRAQRLNAYLAALVQMPTVSSDYAANHIAINYLVDFFGSRGMHIARYEWGNHESFVATTQKTRTPAVMLAAHLDVIPASANMYQLRHEQNKLIGRGVYDMKGAIAAYMELIDTVKNDLARYDIGIMITTDEELGGKDGINGVDHLVNQGYIPRVCVLPDGGNNWQIETSAKGYMHFTLEAHGITGHGSRPWLSDNAAYKLLDAIQELRGLYKNQSPETPTLNVGVIQGGEAPNKVPDYLRAEIETRPVNIQQLENFKKIIPEICAKHGVKATLRTAIVPIYNSLTDPYIAGFAKSIQKITGITNQGCLSMAGSDARFFTAVGVPCVVFYPEGGGHHSETEWISERAFHQMCDVVEDYIKQFALASQNPTLH